MKHFCNRSFATIGAFAALLLAAPFPSARAIDLVVSGPPTLTGSGPTLAARYVGVATVDGTAVDLLGEIVAQSTNKTNVFRADGDDFRFQIQDGEDGEDRWATVRWTFLESGISTPVVVEDLALTIDDLDDYWSRTESFETADALSHSLNDPTYVTATSSGGTLTATGGGSNSSGDPEAAVMMIMKPGSSFVITYRCSFNTDANAGFIHDGDGDFVFDNLVRRLYYTYHFDNQEDIPVLVDFSTALPTGLLWDTEFTPQVTDSVSGGTPNYDGSLLTITGLRLLPGESSITFSSRDTTMSGTIEASGTILPTAPEGPIQGATAAIVLP